MYCDLTQNANLNLPSGLRRFKPELSIKSHRIHCNNCSTLQSELGHYNMDTLLVIDLGAQKPAVSKQPHPLHAAANGSFGT